MISSTSSSSSVLRPLVLLAGLLSSASVQAAPALGSISRVAVFPLDNLAAGGAPEPALQAALVQAVARAGFEVVTGDPVERFLAAERIRYTGGISRAVAKAAREQLGLDGIVVASLEQGRAGEVKFALTLRLVTTSDPPEIAWMDGFARTGDDAPGLLGLGVIGDPAELRRQGLEALSRSLAAARARSGPAGKRCAPGRTYAPKLSFRVPDMDDGAAKTVVVLPFVNSTKRDGAGEIVRLQLIRQLAAVAGLRVVDPGDVREGLLEYRITLRGGISLESARTMLNTLRADWVVGGDVRRFEEDRAAAELNLYVLDRAHDRLVWQSRSYNEGTDGVLFFGKGRVSTASALVCRMTSEVVEEALPLRFGRSAKGGRIAR